MKIVVSQNLDVYEISSVVELYDIGVFDHEQISLPLKTKENDLYNSFVEVIPNMPRLENEGRASSGGIEKSGLRMHVATVGGATMDPIKSALEGRGRSAILSKEALHCPMLLLY